MGYVQKIIFVFVLASIYSVQSHHACSLTDTECTRNGVQKLLYTVVQGSGGIVKLVDPLSLPDEESKFTYLNHKLTNGTLTGIETCVFQLFKMNPEASTSRGEIMCSELVLKYDVYGGMRSTETDGAGSVTFTLNNYFVSLDCVYELHTSEKDNKLHLTFVKYDPTFEPKGPVSVDIHGPLQHSDSIKDAQAKQYATNTGLGDLEKILRVTQLPKYLDIIMIATNNHLKEVSFDEIFQQ